MSAEEVPRTLADRLDRLFRTITPGGVEYSSAAVAEAITRDQGISISHTYVWQLRTGRRDNPTLQHLGALAKFFGVPVSYFLDDAESERIARDLRLLTAIKETGVSEIALRAAELSADSRETVGDMIMKMWRLENPEAPEDR